MKYLNEIMELNIFSLTDAYKIIGNESTTKKMIKIMLRKKYISKIKKNLYCANDLVNGSVAASKYEIGCQAQKGNFISHHSVFEYYGLYNQMYNVVDISSTKIQKEFEFEDIRYIYHLSKNNIQVNKLNGIMITSLERAIVDIIYDSKNYELDELLECISLLDSIDLKRIEDYLNSLQVKLLYKKVGYILSFYKDKFKITEDFFSRLKKAAGSSRGYYDASRKENNVYDARWQLYVAARRE